MPSPKRRPKLHRPPPADLSGLAYWELVELAKRGEITWSDISAETHRQVLASNGGIDPYAHLRIDREPLA